MISYYMQTHALFKNMGEQNLFHKERLKMKKLFSLLLASLCVVSLAVTAGAAATLNEQRNIPMAATAPTIDGVISGDEWDNALTVAINKDTVDAITGTTDNMPSATYYWMWDYEGLYFFADVKDNTVSDTVHPRNNGSYNSGDGVQFCIYPDVNGTGNAAGDLYFWSLVVADDGNAEIGEHFVFGTTSAGADVEDAVVACTKNGASYTIEAFMPAVCWESSNKPITVVEGTTFAMANVLMEMDGAAQSLLCDTAWFDGVTSNKYTLTTDVAGHVDAPETVAEEVVADVAAPQTFDMGVIAAVAAIVSAAGYAISKKR